ncbi:MAG: helix-turn-helix transcriptional regulator [Patescibacteria group bacterium]|nr:helix-turn-helix transcriptional regulator [Patescibacteria group bacterium]
MQGPAARAKIIWKNFGRDVRDCRERHAMTLRRMSADFGIDRSTLSRAENGKPISPELFVWLADWAGHDTRDYLAPLYIRPR